MLYSSLQNWVDLHVHVSLNQAERSRQSWISLCMVTDYTLSRTKKFTRANGHFSGNFSCASRVRKNTSFVFVILIDTLESNLRLLECYMHFCTGGKPYITTLAHETSRYLDDPVPNIVYAATCIFGCYFHGVATLCMYMYLTPSNTFGLCGDIWTTSVCGNEKEVSRMTTGHSFTTLIVSRYKASLLLS